MANPKLYFKIKPDIYPATIHVSIGQTDEEFTKSTKTTKKPLEDFMHMEKLNFDGIVERRGSQIYMRLGSFRFLPYHYGVLSHEVFHVVEEIAKMVGLKHSGKSSEAFAYLIGYITEEIYDKLSIWVEKNP